MCGRLLEVSSCVLNRLQGRISCRNTVKYNLKTTLCRWHIHFIFGSTVLIWFTLVNISFRQTGKGKSSSAKFLCLFKLAFCLKTELCTTRWSWLEYSRVYRHRYSVHMYSEYRRVMRGIGTPKTDSFFFSKKKPANGRKKIFLHKWKKSIYRDLVYDLKQKNKTVSHQLSKHRDI